MSDVDHKTIVAGLTKAERAELTARKDMPGLVRVLAHGGAIVLLGGFIALKGPYWPLAMPPLGVLIVFMFTTLHETIHETAFRSPWLNRWVARIAGFLNLIPPIWFRYFHFAHHRFTHNPEKDPELASRKPSTVGGYVVHLSGLPFWASAVRALVVNAAGRSEDAFVPARGREKVVREARSFLALYAIVGALSVYAGSALVLWIWVVPALAGQPFLRAYLLAEHARCPHVANMLENTRTTFTTGLVRFIAWNMPFHAEHHSYPAVPFHRLPRFHSIVRDHLRQTERGYVRFHRGYAGTLGKAERESTAAE